MAFALLWLPSDRGNGKDGRSADDYRTLRAYNIPNMKTCTIANTQSGGWERNHQLLERLARESDSELLRTGDDLALPEVLDLARRNACRRLIVAGGDGTLSRVVNALGPGLSEFELAILPLGTGNDLARSVGVPVDSLQRAWSVAVEGEVTPMDVVRTSNGRSSYLVNAATAGFGGKVSTDVQSEDKNRWGALAYWITAFSRFVELEEFQLRLDLDDRSISLPTYGLAIANGRYVGGGFPVAPEAWVDDGMLDITTIPVLPTLDLLAVGIDFMLGTHHAANTVSTYRSSFVRIHAEPDMPFSLDGEPTRSFDATFETLPRALRLVKGPDAVAVQTAASRARIGGVNES
jgi:diacylglycerol kinase (ATP)